MIPRIFGLLLFLSPLPLAAQAPVIPGDQLDQAPYIRPVNGMTMKQVLRWYGEPVRRHDPVGRPPITRWDYPGYSVYFEYDQVITSVPPASDG